MTDNNSEYNRGYRRGAATVIRSLAAYNGLLAQSALEAEGDIGAVLDAIVASLEFLIQENAAVALVITGEAKMLSMDREQAINYAAEQEEAMLAREAVLTDEDITKLLGNNNEGN